MQQASYKLAINAKAGTIDYIDESGDYVFLAQPIGKDWLVFEQPTKGDQKLPYDLTPSEREKEFSPVFPNT